LICEVAATLSLDDVRAWQLAASTRSVNSLSNNTDWWNYTSDDVLQQVQDTVIRWCVQVNKVHIDELSLVRQQTPSINAEPASPNAETIAHTRGTASFAGTGTSRPPTGWRGPTPVEQEQATKWLQDTKEDIALGTLEKMYKA